MENNIDIDIDIEDDLTELLNQPLTSEQLIKFNTHVALNDLIYTHCDEEYIQNLMDKHKLNTYHSALMIAIILADNKHHKAAAITFNIIHWSLSNDQMVITLGITTDKKSSSVQIWRSTYCTGVKNESIGSTYDAIYNINITTDSNAIVKLQPAVWFGKYDIPIIIATSNGYNHTFSNVTKENPIFWSGLEHFGLKVISTSPIIKIKSHATGIIYSDIYHSMGKKFNHNSEFLNKFIYISYDEKDIADDIKKNKLDDRNHWITLSGMLAGDKIKKQFNMPESKLSEVDIDTCMRGVAIFTNADWILSKDKLTLYPGIISEYGSIETLSTMHGNVTGNCHAICNIIITTEDAPNCTITMTNVEPLGNLKFKYNSTNKNGVHTFEFTKENPAYWLARAKLNNIWTGLKFESTSPIISYECKSIIYTNPSHSSYHTFHNS